LQGATSAFPSQQQSGVGDAATYLPGGEQLHVVKGQTYFVVSGDISVDEARDLAQKVISRLN
jgi:hypothetical protein